MKTSIQFLGGAGTVTGSKFLLQFEEKRILIDCGLFQGLKELRLQNWASFPVDPKTIHAALITHAHLDHTGYLPLLTRGGFSGPIYCTGPTRSLSRIILMDSAKIQEEDAERANTEGYSKHTPAKPLYTTKDVEVTLSLIKTAQIREWIPILDSIHFRFSNSGHILGSALIEVKTPDGVLAFTGDLGRSDPLLLHPPEAIKNADYIITESTYGDRLHSPLSPLKQLAKVICDTVDRKGHIVIPSFAVGRTQDVLYLLSILKQQSQIKDLPVFLDSPMGINTTEVFADYPEWHRLSSIEVDHLCKSVTMIKSQQQSEELRRKKESSIIIAGSGMLTGGRVLSHLVTCLPNEANSIVLVGYQAPSTRGSLLKNGLNEIKIYGKYIPVRAHIEEISTLSAHADQKDLLHWLQKFESAPKTLFVVHGEPQAANALQVKVRDTLNWQCIIPKQNDTVNLFD